MIIAKDLLFTTMLNQMKSQADGEVNNALKSSLEHLQINKLSKNKEKNNKFEHEKKTIVYTKKNLIREQDYSKDFIPGRGIEILLRADPNSTEPVIRKHPSKYLINKLGITVEKNIKLCGYEVKHLYSSKDWSKNKVDGLVNNQYLEKGVLPEENDFLGNLGCKNIKFKKHGKKVNLNCKNMKKSKHLMREQSTNLKLIVEMPN